MLPVFLWQKVEKTEDASLNSSKKEGPREVELLQQVTAELTAEVKTLKEELEREKQTSSDVKSLKTQQVCTLTFKLANAVRQRERAEEELAKIQKEMEELKEVIKTQEEEIKDIKREDAKNVKVRSEVENEEKKKNVESELKKIKDDEEAFKKQEGELKGIGSKSLANGQLTSETEHCNKHENTQQQFQKEKEFNEEVLKVPDNQIKGVEFITLDGNLAEHRFLEETGEVKKNEKAMADGVDLISVSSIEKEERDSLNESAMNGTVFLHLDPLKNECGKLLIENGSLENSLQEETSRDCAPQAEISAISSLELSEFESWNENSSLFLEKPKDSFYLDNFQNSSSEKNVSSHANSSFETCEEFADDKDDTTEDIPGGLFSKNESFSTVPNVEYGLAKSTANPDERKDEMLEKEDTCSARKNRRMHSRNSEDQESSPPTSPDIASSGYLSNGENLPIHHGMLEDHSVAVYPGNNGKGQEANRRRLANVMTTGSHKEQDKKTLEGFAAKYQATLSERNRPSTRFDDDGPKKDIKISQEKQNNFSSQNMGEEVKDLKKQLKSALKEIEELRQENKEMKKEMRKLSTSAEENAFLVKTTQFTDRLLREMKEREAKIHAPRPSSTNLESYRLDRDFSYSGNTELSPMIWQTRARRRSDECLSRSSRGKTTLPSLKSIGAKLKEITRSVENMAMDPELGGETLLEPPASDFLDYAQSMLYPSLNDHFQKVEQLILPGHSSERLSAFKQEMPSEASSRAYTVEEKLREERILAPSNDQNQLTEKDCTWRDKTFQIANHAPELSGFDSRCSGWHQDTQDHIQRYIVRSSDYIAKLRDLKPEELGFYSKSNQSR